MEAVPRGASFARIKMLWEIGVHVAADPTARATNNREMCIMVGNGSGDKFTPSLRMATGSPWLAMDVARGDLDVAIMNPSALLTQAYRGTGMFSQPLPLRALANYPSWDRFVLAVHPRTGLRSLAELKDAAAIRCGSRRARIRRTRRACSPIKSSHCTVLLSAISNRGVAACNGFRGPVKRPG